MTLLSVLCSPRSRAAYAALRKHVPSGFAARAVHELEHARDVRTRVQILSSISELEPELPSTPHPHHSWLAAHGYATVCSDCGRAIDRKERCEVDLRQQSCRCLRCALSANAGDWGWLWP